MPFLFVLWLLLLTATAVAQKLPAPPAPLCEFRGAWIATVGNIDWPSKKGLSTEQQQQELSAIVDAAAAMRLNALVFQVRPSADAFYISEREPWSEWLTGRQGQAPSPLWDPLAFLIERAHRNGLEVHAWFNPFRAKHESSKSTADPLHVTRRLADACVPIGTQTWMDPGDPRAVDWTLAVIQDVVRRYDLDGVHLDDYFYPYPVKDVLFPDDASYSRYQKSKGKLERADWRRHNIDALVARLADETHKEKPFVKVGISPFGIARPGVPSGIKAGIDQYSQLYADVIGWLQDGRIDYLAPQLYWPIDQKAQSFAVLLPWWNGQNQKNRHMWPGLNASEAQKQKRPWREDELVQQVDLIRQQGADPGHVHFSWKAIKPGTLLNRQLVEQAYGEAAPVPASPWLGDAVLPAMPEVTLETTGNVTRAKIVVDSNARMFVVQVLRGTRWRTWIVCGRDTPSVQLPNDARAVAVRGIAKNGLFGDWRGLPIPR
ncbi:MAG: family 10 glycosylhydrolase [Planctomycetota bacterium]